MKNTIKVICIIFITIVAFLALALIFKAITNTQFVDIVKKVALSAVVLVIVGSIFQLFKGSPSNQ